jgi:cobalamin biosynthesis Mg chelatase CobN
MKAYVRPLRVLALVAGLTLAACASVATAGAATTGAGSVTTSEALQQTAPVAGTYSGTVKQNGPALVTHDSQGDRTLVVQPGAPIARNGKSAVVSDLKKGDKLTATLAADGTVTRIDATSSSSNTGMVVGIVLLVLLVIAAAALLVWLFSRRRRTRHGVLSHG